MYRTSLAFLIGLVGTAQGVACQQRGPGSSSPPSALPAATAVATLEEPRASHGAVTLRDGRVLVVGGFRKAADGRQQVYSATSELYDPTTDRVTPGPTMREARADHVTVPLFDGGVLVAGGWGDAGVLRSAEVLDPTTQTWRAAGTLAVARGGSTATVLADGRVVIIGGLAEAGASALIDVYSSTETAPDHAWSSGGALLSARSGHTATLATDGTILVAGGMTNRGELVRTIERYDPATRTSSVVGMLNHPRYKHAAQLLDNGDLLVIGGADLKDWTGRLRSTEIFEVATGMTWPGAQLADARFKLSSAVVALGHDRFAVVGGAASIEVLMTNDSERVAVLPDALHFATATRVGTDVIVAGGYDARLRASPDIRRISLEQFVNRRN